jgi:hypothetical protein
VSCPSALRLHPFGTSIRTLCAQNTCAAMTRPRCKLPPLYLPNTQNCSSEN